MHGAKAEFMGSVIFKVSENHHNGKGQNSQQDTMITVCPQNKIQSRWGQLQRPREGCGGRGGGSGGEWGKRLTAGCGGGMGAH